MNSGLKQYISSVKYSRNGAVFFALLYTSFVLIFPWEMIKKDLFDDYWNYYNLLTSTDLMMNFIEGKLNEASVLSYMSNELLWGWILVSINYLTNNATITLHLISSVILFSFSYFIFRRQRSLVLFVLLLNPYFIDLVLSQIRSSFAWLVVFYGYYYGKRNTYVLMIFFAAMIHISSIIFPVIIVINGFLGKVRVDKKKIKLYLIYTLSGLAIYFLLIHASEIILEFVNDHRADISATSGSLLQSLPFMILLFLQFTSTNTYKKMNSLAISITFVSVFVGLSSSYYSRLKFVLYPLMLESGLQLSPLKKYIFLFSFLSYELFAYLYWTKLFYILF